MCGIGGIKRMGKEPIPLEAVQLLWKGLENRGNDAAGIAVSNPDKCAQPGVHIWKTDDPAWRAMNRQDYKDWAAKFFLPETCTVLVHTRAATGNASPRQNDNNHPMFKGHTAVIHNGIIRNHETLFTDMKLERSCATDSDIFRGILDNKGFTKAAIRDIARCAGSAAIAAVTPDDPEKLLLVRSGNPLTLAKLRSLIIFASEKTYIYSAFKVWEPAWGLEFATAQGMGWLRMRDDSAWLIGGKGLEWHDECKIAYNYSEPCRKVYENYAERNANWDKDSSSRKIPFAPTSRVTTPMRVRCRGCHGLNKMLPEQINLPIDKLDCGHCHKSLAS